MITRDEKNELCKDMWTQCKDELTRMCAYKLSSCPAEVDDVIAEAFYCLCVAVLEGRTPRNPKAWLIAVTNNIIKQKYSDMNKEKGKLVSFDEEKFESYSYDEDLLWDSLISDSVIESLGDDILKRLRSSEQLLYRYIYTDKLKMKEIAKLMNISPSAVKQRNYRLSKKLKVLIKRQIENLP